MSNTYEKLISVLCDPDQKVCIQGSDEDKKILQECIKEVKIMLGVKEKMLELLKEWRRAFIDKVICKPEKGYLDWFVKLNRDTNTIITKYEKSV